MIDGEVPETVMKVQAYDISHICVFSWYQWIMFRDGPVQYMAVILVLETYFVPS